MFGRAPLTTWVLSLLMCILPIPYHLPVGLEPFPTHKLKLHDSNTTRQLTTFMQSIPFNPCNKPGTYMSSPFYSHRNRGLEGLVNISAIMWLDSSSARLGSVVDTPAAVSQMPPAPIHLPSPFQPGLEIPLLSAHPGLIQNLVLKAQNLTPCIPHSTGWSRGQGCATGVFLTAISQHPAHAQSGGDLLDICYVTK